MRRLMPSASSCTTANALRPGAYKRRECADSCHPLAPAERRREMPSIVKRTTDAGPRYDVRYRDPEGKQRKRTFARKVDADRFAVTVAADVIHGRYLDPDAGRI